MKVVYAHTDSLYVPVPSIEKAQEIREVLNKHIQDEIFPNLMELEDHPMDLEFEKYYSVLGVGATKNRNAGFIIWKDGVYLTEKEFVCTGFTLKRIAESAIAKEVQKNTIQMWINQKTEKEITTYAKEKYNAMLDGKIKKLDLVKRSRVRKGRMSVACQCKKEYEVDYIRKLLSIMPDTLCEKDTCNSKLKFCKTLKGKRPSYAGGFAGVLYYNEHINPKDKLTDSFYHMRCKFNISQKQNYTNWNGQTNQANYIATRNLKELSDYEPDWIFLAQSDVVKKVIPIFEAMNWDISNVIKDDKQKILDEWF